ncbi:bifunctional GNAT family N-acetyltransferase/PLP-dependent aspartate aminotransferase family protein [Candidatus Methylopumilus universalis]|uniref:bifunctional GNAT family N-acetyltransferase/PLP-dependent aspartate aminotransferase family protein n=1 Tax=Candidatus Methylopumilus universalis TaxID=2588536 RepID=UPI0011220446|nr:aminotransferase class I/II-fold pyridoxal phosphate-dependent enzyme [Candidatus Methylopumilus universalis]QDC88106.1 aminotransferase class I/II-fold pyridoxal phosphate-dependent enzyme [Candidatus Methylopumilus universalis]
MTNIRSDVYKKSVTDNFYFLKNSKNIKDAYLKAIPIENSGFLLPVSQYHAEDEALLENLTRWRNENVEVYPTQFQATIESTRSWILNRLVMVEDRILFIVVDAKGSVVGHMGFNGCHNDKLFFEIDNVVRGNRSAEKGLFSKAMQCLIEWARKTINVEGFFLRVMDDNPHAIEFYKKNNFAENKRIPLIKEINGNTVLYREAGPGEEPIKYFVNMEFKPSIEKIGESLILTAGPSVSAKEGFYSYDAALKGWNSEWSKYLTKFERNFADYIGVKYAMATSSCTGALQIGLMALDIGPGDEVIVPDQTWVATANAVRYVGAIPIFADVELDTWNLDVKSVEGLITNKTKAIMPVHMYGHPARMDGLVALANKYNLKIVEDAAPAIGAEWQGKRCGSFGDFAGFSFQGAKLMVTGEGGMLVTNNDDLYKKALKIWDQGRNPNKVFWIDEEGVKFKMSNIQAAIGLAQLERVDELIEMKRRVFSWYEEILHDVPTITLNKEINEARSIYWMSSIRLDVDAPLSRNELMKILKSRNIDSRPVFPAISQYPIWPKQQSPQPIASLVGNQAINLPSGVCLSKDEVMYVARNIKELLSK